MQGRGSSPHPWGTRKAFLGSLGEGRFIPTPVGNTMGNLFYRRVQPVHPHTRGEHLVNTTLCRRVIGSSPHPWGTLTAQWSQEADAAVHPHTRGEHELGGIQRQCCFGSSPRPWGTPPEKARALAEYRFIPTPVGNTRMAKLI